MKMTEEQANAYVKSVLAGEVKLEGLEADAVTRLKRCEERLNDRRKLLQRIEKQSAEVMVELERVFGEMQAYTGILVEAQEKRGEEQHKLPEGKEVNRGK